ncbi:MAG: HIT domain-containing protein [Candidatus Pacebacteria bacterium]|nr:HIT domain-containing protein [Candidatus Paceibacterota bacterium]MDD3072130.1 HIT domain-containing protein [Candidatus Paceibacterota bacterium]MDD3728805.1 HIT domain-containing protein [Candidatus Paceibacterota bacterium]MDD4201336.1 HIT domain-containing protein [Candidatus Paceibacterota bacterium]MDD4467493.1 HIT domain-containing protein [Candidatus Paceibacterota bacterium]
MEENKKPPSELRFDLVSKNWVVVASGRAKRPESFKKKKKKKPLQDKNCPFRTLANQEQPVLMTYKGKEVPFGSKKWTLAVIPNKFPAVVPSLKLNERIEGGIYEKMDAVGFHEVVITKSHSRHMADFKVNEVKEVFNAYRKRYLFLKKQKHVNHISIFHNQGEKAGASVNHPHSQIITTPLIDVDLLGALSNSEKYFKKTNKCIYCKMSDWERKEKERVVFENKEFIALCPFASKSAFQIIITPKKHRPYFEKISEKEITFLSEAFSSVMKKIKKGLGDPDYNFYLHSAPCDGKKHDYYHYHWTILPRTSTFAGFEIGTRMEILVVKPEKAAKYLREQ